MLNFPYVLQHARQNIMAGIIQYNIIQNNTKQYNTIYLIGGSGRETETLLRT